MTRKRIDDQVVRTLWFDPSVPILQIADRCGVCGGAVSARAKLLGLPPRKSIMNSKTRQLYQPKTEAKVGEATSETGLERLAEVRPLEAVDMAILASNGRYRDLAQISKTHGLGMAEVQRRHHKLRAAR